MGRFGKSVTSSALAKLGSKKPLMTKVDGGPLGALRLLTKLARKDVTIGYQVSSRRQVRRYIDCRSRYDSGVQRASLGEMRCLKASNALKSLASPSARSCVESARNVTKRAEIKTQQARRNEEVGCLTACGVVDRGDSLDLWTETQADYLISEPAPPTLPSGVVSWRISGSSSWRVCGTRYARSPVPKAQYQVGAFQRIRAPDSSRRLPLRGSRVAW